MKIKISELKSSDVIHESGQPFAQGLKINRVGTILPDSENAELIVRAVNCHEELFLELKMIHDNMIPEGPDCETWHRIKALLKRAKGEV